MLLKSREQSVRRKLDKIGCRLIKSRKQSGISEGLYMVVNNRNLLMTHWGFDGWVSIEEIEEWIKEQGE